MNPLLGFSTTAELDGFHDLLTISGDETRALTEKLRKMIRSDEEESKPRKEEEIHPLVEKKVIAFTPNVVKNETTRNCAFRPLAAIGYCIIKVAQFIGKIFSIIATFFAKLFCCTYCIGESNSSTTSPIQYTPSIKI